MINFYYNMRSCMAAAALAIGACAYAEQGTLDIVVKDITDTDATVVITPSSDDLKYYWRMDTKTAFEAAGGADKVVENRIAVWERDASYYDDTTWQEAMSWDMRSGVTEQSVTDRFDPLTPDTDYVVSAFAMDGQGNLTTPVTIKEFSNKAQTLTIELKDPSATDATVVITPADDDLTYYWGLMTKYMFEKVGGADKIVDNRIASWTSIAGSWDNTTWQEVMGWDLKSGPMEQPLSERFSIYPDNDYVIYGFGMDTEGNLTAPVVTCDFATIKAVPSDNTFTIKLQSVSVDDTGRATVKAQVTPSNADRYAVRMYEKVYVDKYDLNDGAVARKEIINDYLLSARDSEIFSGEQTVVFTNRKADADCYLLVVGLDENKAPSTDLCMFEFKTEATAPTQSISLEVSDITPMNAHLKITPSDDDMYYYIDIAPTSLVEQKGGVDIIPQQFIIDWWKFIAEQYEDVVWQDCIPLQCHKGVLETTVKELVEKVEMSTQYWDSDWTLYAVGFSPEGEILTPTAVFNYTSPAPKKSDLSFEFELVSVVRDEPVESKFEYYTAEVSIYPSRSGEEFKAGYGTKSVFDSWVENENYGMNEYIKQQWLQGAVSFTDAVTLRFPGFRRYSDFNQTPMYYKIMAMGWDEGPSTEPYIYDLNYDEATGVTLTKSEDTVVIGGQQRIIVYGNCENVAVYSAAGQVMGVLRGASSLEVPAGIYVVRYMQDGKACSAKVAVK